LGFAYLFPEIEDFRPVGESNEHCFWSELWVLLGRNSAGFSKEGEKSQGNIEGFEDYRLKSCILTANLGLPLPGRNIA
jgi:hypothetical protein